MSSLSKDRKYDTLITLSQCQHYQPKAMRRRADPLATISRHSEFKLWQSGQSPGVIMIKGVYRTGCCVKSLSTSAVTALRQQKLPAAWILKPPVRTSGLGLSATGLTQDLTCQVLRLNLLLHTEK